MVLTWLVPTEYVTMFRRSRFSAYYLPCQGGCHGAFILSTLQTTQYAFSYFNHKCIVFFKHQLNLSSLNLLNTKLALEKCKLRKDKKYVIPSIHILHLKNYENKRRFYSSFFSHTQTINLETKYSLKKVWVNIIQHNHKNLSDFLKDHGTPMKKILKKHLKTYP